MRFFNTEGPVRPDDHYCIPPLERIELDTVLGLVRDKKYFVLHAPRQTGKTSALLALCDLLNSGGDYRCVYADFEVGQAAREDTARAMRALLGELARRARVTLGDDTPDTLRSTAIETEGADGALIDVLSRWAEANPRPLVLLIDEIDTLIGDTLVSVLRQLRAGYDPGGAPRIANPIYAEVIPRHLNAAVQAGLPHERAWYVNADGALDVEGLIADFQTFFREHSEHWVQRFDQYQEAGPQLLLQAHLQRVVNGGGTIEREYALGRGRTDLLIRWPQEGCTRKFVVECKLRRGELERTVTEGVTQTRGYMDRCGAEAGHLIVFDRAPERTWAEKIFRRDPAADGAPVTVWGM